MRIAILTVLTSVALVWSARADDPFLFRTISFGTALQARHFSACTMSFSITFHDPTAPPQRTYDVNGSFTFSRTDGRVVAAVEMSAFGDYTTKLTGIGSIGSVSLTAGETVVALSLPGSGVDRRSSQFSSTLEPDRAAALRSVLIGDSVLKFTLSDPMRSFAFPFSSESAPPGGYTEDLSVAGLAIFDDCMGVLDRGNW